MEAFDTFVRQYPFETFAEGQTLLLKDDTPHAVYVIESGMIRAYTITHDGAERLVSMHATGDDIPVGFGLGLTQTPQYFYEAYTKCRVRLVPQPAFRRYLRTHPEAIYERYVHTETLLLIMFSRITALEQSRAGDKIAFMIFSMAAQFGVRLRPYKTHLQLSVTQQEIANSLGLTRETTGSELKKLELKHLISHSRKHYVLYMERLRSYLDKRS